MKHKHAELMIALANDSSLVIQSKLDGKWTDLEMPCWDYSTIYRIKPEPTPDIVKYIVFNNNKYLCEAGCVQLGWKDNEIWPQVKVTFDGETGKIKSAEVIS